SDISARRPKQLIDHHIALRKASLCSEIPEQSSYSPNQKALPRPGHLRTEGQEIRRDGVQVDTIPTRFARDVRAHRPLTARARAERGLSEGYATSLFDSAASTNVRALKGFDMTPSIMS